MENLEVNGRWPKIENQILQEMIVQEFWHEGVLEETVNVVYLKFSEKWFRLYFDCGIVFWREENEDLEEKLALRKHAIYPLIDIAENKCLKGNGILSCKGRAVPGGSEVIFQFSSKTSVIFQSINDITSIKT